MSSNTSDTFGSPEEHNTHKTSNKSRRISVILFLFGILLVIIGNFSISNYRIIFHGFLSAIGLWLILVGILLFIGISHIIMVIVNTLIYETI